MIHSTPLRSWRVFQPKHCTEVGRKFVSNHSQTWKGNPNYRWSVNRPINIKCSLRECVFGQFYLLQHNWTVHSSFERSKMALNAALPLIPKKNFPFLANFKINKLLLSTSILLNLLSQNVNIMNDKSIKDFEIKCQRPEEKFFILKSTVNNVISMD